MPGPAKKPTKLKILEGNPGKRSLPVDEPQPQPALLACPSFIKGPARKEWRRIVPELYLLGLLSQLDRAALAAYCIAFGQLQEVEHELSRMKKLNREVSKLRKKNPAMKVAVSNGMVSITSNGNAVIEPLLSVRKQAFEQMKSFLTEFGMTPASRTRISAARHAEETDPLDRLLNTRKRTN